LDGGDSNLQTENLETAIAAIRKDWGILSSRIRSVEHDVSTDHSHLNLRLHYPALRDAQPTVEDLVRAISLFLTHFSLPRKQVEAVYAAQESMKTPFEKHQAISRLEQEARALFIRARKSSNRTGEAGELLLYLLTEWLLDAPQIIAKMSLKTSAQMPVHGSDGIHVRFDAGSKRLIFYSGEAKLHGDLKSGIASAIGSIKTGLSADKAQHEIELVQRHIDFSGLDELARASLLRYLDPFDEASNDRVEVVTCLIGFDFVGYATLASAASTNPEADFQRLATAQLEEVAPTIAKALTDAGLPQQRVELFLLPLPSVTALRDLFQNQIGWTKDENAGAS
jgi:hypothetical protein